MRRSTAIRLVGLAAATGALLGFRALARQLSASALIIDTGSVGVVGFLYVFAMTQAWGLTPDVLVAALLMLYFLYLWHPGATLPNRARAGLAAGFCYLAKAYALPFFLAHFTATLVWEGLRRGFRPAVRGWSAGVGCFLLVAAPWMIVLSQHEGQFTFSSSGEFNLSFMNPGANNPIYVEGLIPPPDPNGISAWEDPAALPIERWRWWQSAADFLLGARHMAHNVIEVVKHLANQSPGALALGLAGAGALVLAGKRRRDVLAMLFDGSLYTAGYIPIVRWPDSRYLIPVSLLLALCAMVWAEEERQQAGNWRVVLPLVGALALSYVFPAGLTLIREQENGAAPRVIAAQLADVIEPVHRIASRDDWHQGAELAHWLGARFYGVPKTKAATEERRDQNVDFLIVWRPLDRDPLPAGRRVETGWRGSRLFTT